MTTGPAIGLRRAVAEDRLLLIDLLRRSWLRTWAPELPFDAVCNFVRDDPVTAYVDADGTDFTVAVQSGRIVGLAHVSADRIESIEVDPRRLRSGIGTVLLAWAEDRIARSYDVARLEVRAFNRDALAFYRRRGWTGTTVYTAIECGAPVDTIMLGKAVRQPPAQGGIRNFPTGSLDAVRHRTIPA